VAGGRGEVHGGALLLGVDGVVVVAHGAAGEAELAAAIATAAVAARGDVVARLHALL
jgi:fatty acid/phospholipid biosynthesis enzyme